MSRAHLHATISSPRQLLESLRAATPFTFFIVEGGIIASPEAVRSSIVWWLTPYHTSVSMPRILRCLERMHYGEEDIRCHYTGRQIPWKYGSEE